MWGDQEFSTSHFNTENSNKQKRFGKGDWKQPVILDEKQNLRKF